MMSFKDFVFLVFGVLLALLIGLQFFATGLVSLLTGTQFRLLPLLNYVTLWGAGDPAIKYGVEGAGVLHWFAVVLEISLLVGVVVAVAVWRAAIRKNPQNRDGQASVRAVLKELGPKQLLKRASTLRPALAGRTDIEPWMLGYRLGTFRGVELWLRVEDPTIVIGPSRGGKGWYLVLNWIMNAPGAVITTSTRMDNATLTMNARLRAGSPVGIFAPGVEGGTALGHVIRWNPIEGCVDESTLVRRIKGFIPSDTFSGSSTNGGHWDTLGQQLAAHLFHAAACGGLGVETIWEWVGSSKRAEQAIDLIREHPNGLQEHADHLERVLSSPPEQLVNSWNVLPTVLAFMESGAARRWMSPTADERVDLAEFILQRGTLYLVGDKVASRGYARIIGGLLAEVDYITKGLADASPGTRLNPPVTYIIDEAGSFEYEGLYELITAGGGRGRVGVAVYQSRNQLDEVGGPGIGATLWDAAVAKIVLPGGGDFKALQEMSNLIGEIWYEQVTHNSGDSVSRGYSLQKRSIIEPSEIRELPEGTGVLFYRRLKPIFWRGIPFHDHPRYAECIADQKQSVLELTEASPFKDIIEKHAKELHA
jgi:type IV secretory pathway TraG/TraD family ATPase VirD4